MTGGDPERNEIIEIGCARTRLPGLEAPANLGARVVPRTMRDADELGQAIPRLDWDSYATLAGPIALSPEQVAARRQELAAHVITEVRLDVLVAKARR